MNRAMPMAVLLRATVLTGWRRLWTGRRLFATIAAAVAGLAIMGSLYGLSRYVLSGLAFLLGDNGLAGFLGLAFSGAILFMFITSVQLAFSHLFFADDLALLFASPVPAGFVLGIKLGVVAAGAFGVFLLVAGPVTWAYLGAVHAADLTYLVALGYGGSLALLAAGAAVWFNLALVRFIPARLMKQLYAVVGILVFLAIYMVSQLLPGWLAPGDHPVLPIGVTGLFGQDIARYSLLAWPVVQASRGQAWLWPFLLWAAASVAAVLGSATLARQGLYQGWTAFSETQRRSRPVRNGAVGSWWAQAWLGPGEAAIIGKDWKYLRRDVQEWVQLFMPAVVLVVLTLRTLWDRSLAQTPGLVSVNVAVMALVGVLAGGSLGLYAIGREGLSIGIIRAAPVRGREVLAAKFWAGYLPSVLTVEAFAVAVLALLHMPFRVVAGALVAIALVSAGSNGIAIAVGSMYPRFDAKALKQRVTTTGSLVYLAAEFVYGALITVVAAASVIPDFLPASIWRSGTGGLLFSFLRFCAAVPAGWRHLFGGLALAVICVLAAILPLRLAAARLENLEV